MRVLVTSSRMPFAFGMVRELADAGHEVYAADDYPRSPGSHSKYLAGHFVYPSARERTDDFIAAIGQIASDTDIEAIVPAFEEAFYLAARRADLPETAASDMTWDGEPISGMSDDDAALLADLSSDGR